MNHGNTMPLDVAMLNSDPNLAVDFIIDNNPEEVQAQLSGLNLLSVAPQNATVDVIKNDVRRISDVETLQEVLTVPYVNSANNYTGGLESELTVAPYGTNGMPKSGNSNGIGIINGITTLGQNIAGYFISENNVEIAGINADAQADLTAAQQAQLEAQLAAGKTFGIPTSAFIAIIGAMVAVFAVVLISTKN